MRMHDCILEILKWHKNPSKYCLRFQILEILQTGEKIIAKFYVLRLGTTICTPGSAKTASFFPLRKNMNSIHPLFIPWYPWRAMGKLGSVPSNISPGWVTSPSPKHTDHAHTPLIPKSNSKRPINIIILAKGKHAISLPKRLQAGIQNQKPSCFWMLLYAIVSSSVIVLVSLTFTVTICV